MHWILTVDSLQERDIVHNRDERIFLYGFPKRRSARGDVLKIKAWTINGLSICLLVQMICEQLSALSNFLEIHKLQAWQIRFW